ncbi:MAG: serine/threonine protein kinase [Hamadaea sp.]|uniref:serine/threonine-protein kinase n=1 Tax=Hamadaea sp. TaxID=2024425 RepID=UPI0017F5D1BC|nr:serine/threonine-protein kinase [Hamadaea sp.]NUR70602.1 serine/threonine protein kinase [Hamadaea sp.]NUT19269.1 serine/threonine protein kinase [Hamadaea sp.]
MTWSVPGYTAVQELGRGASGLVVLATHNQTGVPVAIKYLADNLKHDETFLREFRAEARILAEVQDDHVARLYEYVEDPGGAAIVMELVNGVALRKLIREQGPAEPEAALVVLKGSLLGLAASHKLGIVHRDYKPENVLVDAEGQSKLADFGIAVRAGRTGALAGTPSYMAPEQWAGGTATPQTDIYAATATFFECLTGAPPYRAPGDLVQLRRQHESAPIPVDNAPEGVRGLLRRGLAKDPAQRPTNATLFLRELEAVAGAAYGPEWEEEGKKKLARRALLLAALFPLALASMSGTAVADSSLGRGLGHKIRSLSSGVKKAVVAGAITVVVVGGGVGGCVALNPTDAANTSALPSSSPSTSPSVELTISESPSASPSDSASPSVSPTTASPTPTKSKTKSPSPKPTPTSASPKPAPSIIRFAAGGTPSPSPTCGAACTTVWYLKVSATAYYGGYGNAVLHIGIYNPNLASLWGPNSYPFTINGSGSFPKTVSIPRSQACGDYKVVILKAWVTIGGATVKEAQVNVNCY